MSVCVLGGINWDVVTHVDDLPRRGETIHARALEQSAGGKGLNQAVAAARYGVNVVMLGATGSDGFAASLRRTMHEAGIDDRAVLAIDDAPTGLAQICLARNGDNTIVVAAGANARFGAAGVASAEFSDCTVFVTQFEATLDAVEALFRSAPAIAGTRILNAAPALTEARHLLALADILVVNETELQRFAALDAIAPTQDAMITAARTLIARPRQIVIVTLGPQGCLCVEAGIAQAVPGYRVDVVDTIGAGDCFCGVLGAALAEGLPLRAALLHANAAAALSVGRRGASASSPSRGELDDFLGGSAASQDGRDAPLLGDGAMRYPTRDATSE